MNLEIQKPELAQRVQAQIESGHFSDVDELLEKALDALDECRNATAVAHDTRTGAELIAALQASPYRELEIEPPRLPLGNVRDIAL